ncbi:hypothetical protein [Arthrobacter sp. PAMC25284]|uniref:hypothetical protein n=1 Tax=Arthrobacter sp. PAMC25284 TaxID=2861279 RepID=UPI001C632D65|nr:hypothetical protein [Arthrobacter sp. PAMC25284]QYF91005.1 hypothetical protein KY499_07300 [Arthrobacter sp. PAMC25284]
MVGTRSGMVIAMVVIPGAEEVFFIIGVEEIVGVGIHRIIVEEVVGIDARSPSGPNGASSAARPGEGLAALGGGGPGGEPEPDNAGDSSQQQPAQRPAERRAERPGSWLHAHTPVPGQPDDTFQVRSGPPLRVHSTSKENWIRDVSRGRRSGS